MNLDVLRIQELRPCHLIKRQRHTRLRHRISHHIETRAAIQTLIGFSKQLLSLYSIGDYLVSPVLFVGQHSEYCANDRDDGPSNCQSESESLRESQARGVRRMQHKLTSSKAYLKR